MGIMLRKIVEQRRLAAGVGGGAAPPAPASGPLPGAAFVPLERRRQRLDALKQANIVI